MKMIKILIASAVVTGLAVSVAFAIGNAEKGKQLFNDPKLSGATSGMSCNSCHPNGKGLLDVAKKTTGFKNPAGTFKRRQGQPLKRELMSSISFCNLLFLSICISKLPAVATAGDVIK